MVIGNILFYFFNMAVDFYHNRKLKKKRGELLAERKGKFKDQFDLFLQKAKSGEINHMLRLGDKLYRPKNLKSEEEIKRLVREKINAFKDRIEYEEKKMFGFDPTPQFLKDEQA